MGYWPWVSALSAIQNDLKKIGASQTLGPYPGHPLTFSL